MKGFVVANRISIVMVIVGIVGISLTGGEPDSAVQLGGLVSVAIGGAIALVKEVVQTIKAGGSQ